MGYRLSKIYTRTGDRGDTGLGDGSRVPKDHPRVEAFGTVDELNSHIGHILAHPLPDPVATCLTDVQHDLFDLGGELCIPGATSVTDEMVKRLERQLDGFNETLPPLKEFILPGGSAPSAVCHIARAVCRKAERRMVALSRQEDLTPAALKYVNRLSDLLFVLARTINKEAGVEDVLWRHHR